MSYIGFVKKNNCMDSIWAIETDHGGKSQRNPKTGTPLGCILRSSNSTLMYVSPGVLKDFPFLQIVRVKGMMNKNLVPSLLKYARVLDIPPASNKLPSSFRIQAHQPPATFFGIRKKHVHQKILSHLGMLASSVRAIKEL